MFGLSKNEKRSREAAELAAYYFDVALNPELRNALVKNEPACSPSGIAVLNHVLTLIEYLEMGLTQSHESIHLNLKWISQAKYRTKQAMAEGDMNGYDLMKISSAIEVFMQGLTSDLESRRGKVDESEYARIRELISSPPQPFDDE